MINAYDKNIERNFYDKVRHITRFELSTYPNYSTKTFKNVLKIFFKFLLRKGKKVDRYFWPNGLMAIGLEYSHKKTNDKKDLESLMEYYDNWISKGQRINHLDNIINGYTMLYIFELNGNKKYKRALDNLVEYVHNHPKDEYGSLPYRINNKNPQSINMIFIDTLGMICPFLCRYAKLFKDELLVDLAVIQLKNYLNLGFDERKKLPYHGYNSKTKEKLGIIGWGRAVGWLLIGLIDSLEYIDSSHKDYKYLMDKFIDIVITVLEYQNEDGYFSWQIEAIEGPIDTSTTSMIMYSVSKGLKLEILDNSYEKYIKKSLVAINKSINEGHVNDCSAECRGLGMYPQRYGNYPWAQGPSLALISLWLNV